MEWHGVETTDEVGADSALASRLLQSENFATEEARSDLAEAILHTRGGLFNVVGGKGVMEAD